jgi:GWxTD domain-containing protein
MKGDRMSGLHAHRLIVLLLALNFSSITALPQKTKPSPDEKPRNVKKELKKAYVDWIKGVELIITPEERLAWDKLKTNEEREQFIVIFWRDRDPDPDTLENEYKEEFYERLAYADEHFSSGKPGRMTDRGRIYIKFGKPDDVESHPAGGAYERPSYEGGGSTTTYPFEKWFYRYIPNVRSGVELEFVDPTGTGEYRLARNPDEKDAMLHVPGAGQTIAEQLGFETRADRIANSAGFGRVNYTRAQDSPFEVQALLSDLDRVQPLERRGIGGITDTPTVDDPLNFEYQLNYFRQSDNSVVTALTIQTDNSELAFENVGGLLTARMNIFGRITSVADVRIGKFEDPVVTHATPEELSSVRTRKSAYAKAFILQPGRYRIDVIVRDITSGATGIQHIGFQVPSFPTDRLATSSIVLAAKLESLKDAITDSRFTIGTNKVIPNLTGTFKRGEPVGIYLQVYNALIDQTTLRPTVDVEYVLLKEGKELSRQREDWRDINDAGQRLTLTQFVDTKSLTAGDYEIQIRITDNVSRQTIAPSAKFSVVNN